MAKIIKQYINTNISGKKIYQLGIQAPQNSIVEINGNSNNKITIGLSKIFQIELKDGMYITSIKVTRPTGITDDYYIDVIEEEE